MSIDRRLAELITAHLYSDVGSQHKNEWSWAIEQSPIVENWNAKQHPTTAALCDILLKGMSTFTSIRQPRNAGMMLRI